MRSLKDLYSLYFLKENRYVENSFGNHPKGINIIYIFLILLLFMAEIFLETLCFRMYTLNFFNLNTNLIKLASIFAASYVLAEINAKGYRREKFYSFFNFNLALICFYFFIKDLIYLYQIFFLQSPLYLFRSILIIFSVIYIISLTFMFFSYHINLSKYKILIYSIQRIFLFMILYLAIGVWIKLFISSTWFVGTLFYKFIFNL